MTSATNGDNDTKGQSISRAVLTRLTNEHQKFNELLESQRSQCAKMLGEDVGLEVDMVVRYQDELAIITDIYLDPKSINGISVRVESYNDDLKFAVILSEHVVK